VAVRHNGSPVAWLDHGDYDGGQSYGMLLNRPAITADGIALEFVSPVFVNNGRYEGKITDG